jgi:hypothetical protein
MFLPLRRSQDESRRLKRNSGVRPEPLTGPEKSRAAVGDDQRQAESEQWLARRQLERKLHDGAALRISALALRIGLLRHENGPAELEQWRNDVGQIQDELHAVLQELREVASDIYPPLLDQAGLGPALRELADQRGSDLQLSIGEDRFGPVAEGAAYFAIADWLTACSEAQEPLRVAISRDQDDLTVTVSPIESHHLKYLDFRVRALGGSVSPALSEAEGPHSCGTTMRIPCE